MTANDRELSTSLQQTFLQRIDGDWAATLPSGHLPMLETPHRVAQAIRAFHLVQSSVEQSAEA